MAECDLPQTMPLALLMIQTPCSILLASYAGVITVQSLCSRLVIVMARQTGVDLTRGKDPCQSSSFSPPTSLSEP